MSLTHLQLLQSRSLEIKVSSSTLLLFPLAKSAPAIAPALAKPSVIRNKGSSERKGLWLSCHVAFGSNSLQGIIPQGLMIYDALWQDADPWSAKHIYDPWTMGLPSGISKGMTFTMAMSLKSIQERGDYLRST